MFASITESIAKVGFLGWFMHLSYAVRPVTQLSSWGSIAERELFTDVLMVALLYEAVHQQIPDIPLRAIPTLRGELQPIGKLNMAILQTSKRITQ